MTSILRRLSVASALLLVATLGPITAAHAADPGCGASITQRNTLLTGNVGPCANNGLVIAADGATLDLGGHTIFCTPNRGDGAGVLIEGRTGVTVKNGTITDCDAGVAIVGGSRNTATRLTLFNNLGGSGAGVGAVKYGDGIAIESSSNNNVINNTATHNGPFSGIGIYSLIDSDHPRTIGGNSTGNIIDSNMLNDNSSPRPGGDAASTDNDGIRMENFGMNNQILNNRVDRSGLDGIAIFADSLSNVLRGNIVTNNGFFRTAARRGSGIVVNNRANGNTVENNTLIRNADNGIFVRGPFGAVTVGSVNNIIRFNYAVGNAVLPFIPSAAFGPTFDLRDGNPNCDNNTWFGNTYRTFDPPCVTTGGQPG
jgi:parallel beta-helix repeat protein